MKNIIKTSEIQRKGLKDVYEKIEEYGQAFIVNQRSSKILRIIDDDNPKTLINIIRSIKGIKDILEITYGIKSIGIFGSYARGENGPNSDLDLIVKYEIKSMNVFFNLEDLLKKSLSIGNIDLLTFDGVSPLALKSLKKDVIYV